MAPHHLKNYVTKDNDTLHSVEGDDDWWRCIENKIRKWPQPLYILEFKGRGCWVIIGVWFSRKFVHLSVEIPAIGDAKVSFKFSVLIFLWEWVLILTKPSHTSILDTTTRRHPNNKNQILMLHFLFLISNFLLHFKICIGIYGN